MNEQDYMRRAVELAKKGGGHVSPNPMVGAVIVKNGRIIGEGYHERYGELHAERNALASCRESPEGGDMYVTLEPCCHYGKQPPCTAAILDAKIRRVFIGSADPNPLVAGKGVKILETHGVEVIQDVLRDECDRLNVVFFHYIRTGRPYVVMKYAMTMDGKIASYTGASQWITGEEARRHVHKQRKWLSAIMVGVGTILADDPMLNCRIEGGRDPIRIVCDSNLRTPAESKLVQTAGKIPTILATCCKEEARHRLYLDAGCRIMVIPEQNGRVDLKILMKHLGEEKIDSILLEGGAGLNWSALGSGIVHRVQTYVAPKILGGEDAKSPVEGKGFPDPESAVRLKNSRVICLGEDLLIESEVDGYVHGDY